MFMFVISFPGFIGVLYFGLSRLFSFGLRAFYFLYFGFELGGGSALAFNLRFWLGGLFLYGTADSILYLD